MANQHPNSPPTTDNRSNGPQRPPDQLPKERAEYLADQYGYTPGQINVVRNAVCVGATDAELEFFLATCKRVGLDPFARQIWFVKRRQKIEDSQGNESWVDVGRPETSIDGFRTIAERTSEYEGQAPILWCGKDGKWTDVWLRDEHPVAARATVYRKGLREPMVATALYGEYCPRYKNGGMPSMWKKMPANQLGVRAEAQAFRRAFPRDLSGMVTDGEAEAMEIGASYAAPARPEAKQLDQRKPDAAAKIVDAPATPATTPTAREPVPATQPEVTREQVAEILDSVETSENADDLDREMARCLKAITSAETRDGLQDIGRMITAAKTQRKKTNDDAHANAVIDVLEPALQKRWRELAPQKGQKS